MFHINHFHLTFKKENKIEPWEFFIGFLAIENGI